MNIVINSFIFCLGAGIPIIRQTSSVQYGCRKTVQLSIYSDQGLKTCTRCKQHMKATNTERGVSRGQTEIKVRGASLARCKRQSRGSITTGGSESVAGTFICLIINIIKAYVRCSFGIMQQRRLPLRAPSLNACFGRQRLQLRCEIRRHGVLHLQEVPAALNLASFLNSSGSVRNNSRPDCYTIQHGRHAGTPTCAFAGMNTSFIVIVTLCFNGLSLCMGGIRL